MMKSDTELPEHYNNWVDLYDSIEIKHDINGMVVVQVPYKSDYGDKVKYLRYSFNYIKVKAFEELQEFRLSLSETIQVIDRYDRELSDIKHNLPLRNKLASLLHLIKTKDKQ